MKEKGSVFANGEIAGRIELVQRRNNTGETNPVRQLPRILPFAKREGVGDVKSKRNIT